MKMMNIEQALVIQNPHWAGTVYSHPIKRLFDDLVLKDLQLEEMLIISGIRRCGKSTLMFTLINQLMQQSQPRSILYINFDDPFYTTIYQDPTQLYEVITLAQKLSGHKIEYLFLDEIQNVEGWEQYVKSVYDNRLFKKIVITGSNAQLLKSDYANLLSGRYIETHIYPLCFKEVLNYHHILDNLSLIQKKSEVLGLLDDYMHFGGFPRIHCVSDEEQRMKLLKNYYETILLKDCVQNNDIRDAKTFLNFAYYVFNNLAASYSFNSLGRALSLHENTVSQYMYFLESAYFIYEVRKFSYSIKVQSKSKKKSYCIDNGIVGAASFQFSQNLGSLFENLVYSELVKGNLGSIYFFHDKKECDFIVHGENIMAIQACYEITDKNRERELSGLKAAMRTHDIQQGIVITYNQAEKIDNDISLIPFWQYFF